MSIKSFLQIIILCLIGFIISIVYLKYFKTENNIVEEVGLSENNLISKTEELKNKIIELESKNNELKDKIEKSESKNKKENIKIKDEKKSKKENTKKEVKEKKTETKEIINKEIKNLVKDVEYTSVDQKGNRFYLLANSGKTNKDNKNILDLENVRGEINSDNRATIYITSDYAHYNSENLNSKFYENVIINYEDKRITCINFDINMETNKAIAYNKVVVTDPKSIMKAGIVEFDLKTKDININPEKAETEIEVVTN